MEEARDPVLISTAARVRLRSPESVPFTWPPGPQVRIESLEVRSLRTSGRREAAVAHRTQGLSPEPNTRPTFCRNE